MNLAPYVVGVAGAIGVAAQGQRLDQAGHGSQRMLVVDRNNVLTSGGPDDGDIDLRRGINLGLGVRLCRLRPRRALEWRRWQGG